MSAEKGADDSVDPMRDHATAHNTDEKSRDQKNLDEKHTKASGDVSQKDEEKGKPPGGFDSTPVPHAPPGYTVRITIHRATKLPMSDLSTMSSDPYCLLQINTGLRTRHKEDPELRFRTHTIWKSTEPEWNEEWIIEHMPASGFKLKARIYDEDAANRDDRLGNVHVHVGALSENWEGIKNAPYKIKKRAGSKRAYLLRSVAVCMGRAHDMSGDLYVSVEVLGKSQGEEGGRAYTTGLNYWCQHRSPLLGRIAGRKDDGNSSGDDPEHLGPDHAAQSRANTGSSSEAGLVKNDAKDGGNSKSKKTTGTYDFQANQFQLTGPVPPELYHRFVEFKPWIGSLFNRKGVRGWVMHAALHRQHVHVYNYNRQTRYGVFDGPSDAMTRKFLELVHHDDGGRIFTYVLTLDALFRFTETGQEFGIDMLSKHTMHSDASIYIAFSGEFFIRRLEHPHHERDDDDSQNRNKKSNTGSNVSSAAPDSQTHPPTSLPSGPPSSAPPPSPAYYELIIDNDSGTYRPNAKLLPLLREFLLKNLPGLKIVTLDSQADAEQMKTWKDQQRARKKEESGGGKGAGGKGAGAGGMVYTQAPRRGSSVSSSDEEDLDRLGGAQDGGAKAGGALGSMHGMKEALGPLKDAVPRPRDWVHGKEDRGHEGGAVGDGGIDPMEGERW